MNLSLRQLRAILNRDVQLYDYDVNWYKGKKVFITGGAGSNGVALKQALQPLAYKQFVYDLPTHDVNDYTHLVRSIDNFEPDIIFHFAADKHAYNGEAYPAQTSVTNILGTSNLCQILEGLDDRIRLVTASTCKAIEPVTCYGASKLIAERMTLNVNQRVIRYFNIADSSDNVFEIWKQQAEELDAIYVTRCYRYFISMAEAVSATMAVGTLPAGRYTLGGVLAVNLPDLAATWLREAGIDVPQLELPRRRGDRMVEPYIGQDEKLENTSIKGILKVINYHDQDTASERIPSRMVGGTVRSEFDGMHSLGQEAS